MFSVSQKSRFSVTSSRRVVKSPFGPLLLEIDASGSAIGAVFSQAERPIAFFSRTLSQPEQKQSTVEREAMAIVESFCKWAHFIKAIDTTVKTDQKSVSFIFSRNKSKIENEKLVRRKLELSEFKYDIQYRCGEDNVSAHALSRIHVAATTSSPLGDLVDVHNSLAHPGVTRLLEYIQRHNLPFSLAEVREVVATCRTCLEYKPRFSKPSQAGHIVKASKPFERLGVDIVGPEVPSAKSQSRFVLTVLDEYSRFPFAFTLRNITSQGLFACFSQLFAIFGSPVFIHSDRGSQFISAEFEEFCQSRSISHSRTTPYNPKGNGQTERFNSVHWKGVTCLLHYRRLGTGTWNSVLLEALFAMRSLLCTAINDTPHKKFFSFVRRESRGINLPL